MARRFDFGHRASSYIAALKQGYGFDEAAAVAKGLHYDYSKLSGFEKSVMRRVAPFYNFARQNLPFTLEQLATEPFKEASGIRAAAGLRDKDSFVPGYVGEGFALPLPGAPEGQQGFLSSLGLPIEDETVRALGSLAHGEFK